ncbi:hypothetical protein Pgy4_31851, partial [Pseudomonas savastanoi pv. glycinea str. race 4]
MYQVIGIKNTAIAFLVVIAVRSYIGNHASEGCYRCLCDYERWGDFHAVEGGVEPLFAGQGCEGPY